MTQPVLLILGADHAGFALKEHLKKFFLKKGYDVHDLTPRLVAHDDYPLIGAKAAVLVTRDPGALGVLVCGTGFGMDIAANRINGARATVARSVADAKAARAEDHANILILGGRVTSAGLAEKIAATWLATPYSKAARHKRRVKELDTL